MVAGIMAMRAFNQRVTSDGRRVVDLVDSFGAFYAAAPVLSGVSFPLYVPEYDALYPDGPKYYPEVVVGFAAGESRPIVLGVIDSYDVVYAERGGEEVESTGGLADARLVDDLDSATYLEEGALYAAGASIRMRSGGRIVLAGDSVSMQVGSSGVVRISDGRATSHNAATAQSVTGAHNALVEKVRELQDKLDTIALALSSVIITPVTAPLQIPATPVSPPIPFPLQGVISVLPYTPMLPQVAYLETDQIASEPFFIPPPAGVDS